MIFPASACRLRSTNCSKNVMGSKTCSANHSPLIQSLVFTQSPQLKLGAMLMLEEQMTDKKTTPPTKGKRSVALSGVTAGSTALSTVGTDGKSLHYRGYNILDLAPECAFEEVAYRSEERRVGKEGGWRW